MTPISTTEGRSKGLIDVEVGSYDSTPQSIELAMIEQIRSLLTPSSPITPGSLSTPLRAAPWSHSSSSTPTLSSVTSHKSNYYANRSIPPLLHYRNEELSQMLLDNFHPIRSKRYHTRREAFIRKYKSTHTPARYARELAKGRKDEEDLQSFDEAEGWKRGEEWGWVNMDIPASMATSEGTRVDLYPLNEEGEMGRKGSIDSNGTGSSGESGPVTPLKGNEELPDVSGKLCKMGMQGFEGGGVEDEVKGTKGDVMFQCLYQPQV